MLNTPTASINCPSLRREIFYSAGSRSSLGRAVTIAITQLIGTTRSGLQPSLRAALELLAQLTATVTFVTHLIHYSTIDSLERREEQPSRALNQ